MINGDAIDSSIFTYEDKTEEAIDESEPRVIQLITPIQMSWFTDDGTNVGLYEF